MHHERDEQLPAVITFLLDLPFDLRVPSGTTLHAYERAEDVLVALFESENPTPGGLEIDTRFVFRQSPPDASPIRTAALDAFDDFWTGLEFVDSQPAIEAARRRAPVTIVAASTATLADPRDGVAYVPETIVEGAFDRVLRQLNELLTMLGYAEQNPEVGSVRRTELASHIPVVLDFDLSAGVPRRAELSTLQIHGFDAEENGPTTETVLYAHDLAFRDRLGHWPFRSFVTLLHRAQRDAYAGEGEQSVMALGTATELLVEGVVAQVLRTQGFAPDQIEATLRAGLRNLVRHHLTPLLERLAGETRSPIRWLEDCYRLRNRVAHEGYVPSPAEGARALAATVALAGEVGDALRADPTLRAIGDVLPISRRRPPNP